MIGCAFLIVFSELYFYKIKVSLIFYILLILIPNHVKNDARDTFFECCHSDAVSDNSLDSHTFL